MKTMQANLGLGDARSMNRNRRVKHMPQKSWSETRMAQFRRNVRFSASAKATRTALEVTQAEIAEYFGVCQGSVCNWESGKYNWQGGEKELFEYMTICRQISQS
jgi:DNA-binding transcriptional regulator YiaG